MKKFFKCLLSVCLALALLGTFVFQIAPGAKAVNYLTTLPQLHYGEYGTVNMVYDQGGCYSMQGMTVDANYAYCAKIGSNDAIATITRLEKATGAKVNMTNASNGTAYFYNLGHANALDLATINGVQQMFVTGGSTLVRLTMSGTTLTTAGTYTASYNGTTTSMTAAQIMYAGPKEVKIITKGGKSLYTGTLDPTASSGNIELTHLCNLDVTNVRLKGEMIDYSTFTQQGFDYQDGKVFLPLSGNAYVETINYSVVLVYDIEGATGTVRNDPTLSFRVISGQYAGLFEIEDVEVCDYDGQLYFSTNRRKTESDTNYDAVSFFTGYVYDPAMSTIGPADYRWETVNNEWVCVMDGGNVFNNPIRVNGAINDDTMSASVYHMSRSVVLQHDKPWVLEWKSSGGFGGGGMLLSASKTSTGLNTPYIFRYKNSTFISMGYFDGTQHNNYGIKLSDHGINGIAEHVYRLTNKIASDGSNMVYLSIDGTELGALNNYYIGLADQNKKVDWVNGKDLTFSYQGTLDNSLDQCKLDYLQVWADGAPADPANTYRWESKNDNLTSVTGSDYTQNAPIIYNGSVSGTTYSGACFRLTEPVVLLHDRQWSIQWEFEGALGGGTFLLSAGEGGKNPSAPYLFRYGSNLIFLGANDGTQHANYGIDLSDHGIDGTAKHTYCLTNKVASNGSNMVYLYVDGLEVGPMNNFYGGVNDSNTTSDWLNGRDLVFDYVGNRSYSVNGNYSYLQINEATCSHSYTGNVTAPTCTTPGNTTYTCSVCGHTYVDNITAATGHSYETKVTAPTCTTGGYTTHTCSVCGDTYQDASTAPIGHSYKPIVIEPNCNNPGYTSYTCSVCGDSYTADETDALGHSYKVTVIEPTCVTDGYSTYRCTVCGDIYQSDHTPAKGHNYSSVITAPTCTDQGYTTYTCADCGGSYIGNYTNAVAHSYSSKVTAPTCTAGGYTTYTCTGCGHSYKDQITNPAGHSYKTTVVEPTCLNGGYTVYTCVCGDTYTADQTAATGHSFVEGVCGACGAADPNYNPVVQPTLALKSPTLEFKDMVKVIAFFTAENIDDVVEMGMITYTSKVEEWNVDTAEHVIPGAILDESTGRYFASSQGINAKYLGDTVYLACYAKLTDGSYVYTKLAPYSPIQYATSQLKNSSDVKLKQLVAAMLNYGAAAQNYFGHNTDTLANSSLTAEQLALPEAFRNDMANSVSAVAAAKQGIFANNKGFSKRNPAVSFEGAFSINYFFTAAYAPVDGVTLYYWTEADFAAADVLTMENASGTIAMSDEGSSLYRGDMAGIAAKNIDQAIYVAAVYSDGTTTWTSGVLGYSIGAYCATQATKGGTIADLAMATAVYGYHAKQYFG